jgi:hypothetical protein
MFSNAVGAVRIWPAILYGSVQRPIADGPIEESDERPVAELDDARRRDWSRRASHPDGRDGDDHARCYYKLTHLGRKVLDLECERWQEMLRMAQKKRRQEAY